MGHMLLRKTRKGDLDQGVFPDEAALG